MEFTCIKSQLVELVLPANTTLNRFTFDTQNFLRLKQIVSIEVLNVNDASITPLGHGNITGAQMITGYLTLYGANPEAPNAQGEWLQQIPLATLHRMQNVAAPSSEVFGLFNMVPRNIVWEKSFVEFFAPLANVTAISVLFNVGYMGNEGDN